MTHSAFPFVGRSASIFYAAAVLCSAGTAMAISEIQPAIPAAPAAAAPAPAASAVGEKIPFETETFANGLKVIYHVDTTLPISGVNLWYKVGARNEPKGRSGFAHMFEHLMFMGTRRVPGSDFDNLMETGGGSNNASTSLDRTNYFSNGPAKILPLFMWLDADRMDELGLSMTLEKLNLQRDVVRNEIRQQVENTPYARAYEASYQLAYPEGHPYHMGVYGTHEDLEAATVLNIKDFFATFYTPENCTLVVAGNFDLAEAKAQVKALYGSIARGNAPAQVTAAPVKLEKVVRMSMLDKVELPKINIVYHSPANFAAGDAEMNLIGLVLADGKNARLYQKLVVEKKSAVSVTAGQDGAALGSLFRVEILAKPDADLTALEADALAVLAELGNTGPSDAELAARKATVEFGLLASLQSLAARADKLNEYNYYYGTPDGLSRDLQRYRDASVASVKATAKSVFGASGYLVQRILPTDAQPGESAREKRPLDSTQAVFAAPAPTELSLPSGMNIYVLSRPELPLVSMRLISQSAGVVDAPGPQGTAGAGSLLASMLQEGAGGRDASAFAQTVQSLGATFSTGSSVDSISLGIEGLSRNADEAMGLLADAAIRPAMEQANFDRLHGLHLDELKQQEQEPRIVAARAAARMLLTDESPLALPGDGTIETVGRVQLETINAVRASVMQPTRTTLLIAGDITPEKARELAVKHFGKWANSAAPQPVAPRNAMRPSTGLKVYVVDRPDAVQTVLYLLAPTVARKDEDRIAAELANIVLGGSFTSRLNRNLREVHGFTYGAKSAVHSHVDIGLFTAATSVKAEVTGEAIKEFFIELKRTAAGDIGPDELTKARETFASENATAFGTLGGALAQYAEALSYKEVPTAVNAELAKAGAATTASINAAAKKALQLDKAVLVLVGDAKLIKSQYAATGLPEPVVVGAESVGNAK